MSKRMENLVNRRHPLNESQEGLVARAVNAIFGAVANKKTRALQKAMMKDKEFAASVDRLAKLRDEMDTIVKKQFQGKQFTDFDEWYKKNITPLSK